MAQGIEAPQERADAGDDPFQRQVLRDQLDRVAEEKRRALEDPGPTWREWFFHSAAKVWIGLGFLVVDAWLLVACLDVGVWQAAVPVLAAALYIEFLVYRYLWYSPNEFRPSHRFHRTWYRPVAYGRWTLEAEYVRAHPGAAVADDAPRADEFL